MKDKVYYLIVLLFLVFSSCSEEDEVIPSIPSLNLPTSGDATVGSMATFNVSFTAEGNIVSVNASTDNGSVTVTNITGVGTTSGTADVNLTAANAGPANITLTVTDEAGQSAQGSFLITVNAQAIPVTFGEVTKQDAYDTTGTGRSEAFISIEVMGGVAPLQYAWSNGSTDTSLTNIAPGTYSLTITDADGEMATSDDIVIENFLDSGVVMIAGDGSIWKTVEIDGYYVTTEDVEVLTMGDGTPFPQDIVYTDLISGPGTPTDVNIPVEMAVYNISNLSIFNLGVPVIGTVEGSDSFIQYNYTAAAAVPPSGWTLLPMEIVNSEPLLGDIAGEGNVYLNGEGGWVFQPSTLVWDRDQLLKEGNDGTPGLLQGGRKVTVNEVTGGVVDETIEVDEGNHQFYFTDLPPFQGDQPFIQTAVVGIWYASSLGTPSNWGYTTWAGTPAQSAAVRCAKKIPQ